MVHSAAATAPVCTAPYLTAATHHTLASSSSWQVNGYTPPVDAMRMYPRYYASRRGQCASGALLSPVKGLLVEGRALFVFGGGLCLRC